MNVDNKQKILPLLPSTCGTWKAPATKPEVLSQSKTSLSPVHRRSCFDFTEMENAASLNGGLREKVVNFLHTLSRSVAQAQDASESSTAQHEN